jgi:phosphoglycerol transferase MdoB-like AlkP superfamily enzyme
MNKKTNTILFILGATVFNLLITLILLVLLLVLYGRFLAPTLPETIAPWGFPVLFVVSIVLSFVIYRLALKYFMKKVNMEKYFSPIFGARRPPN